MSAFVTFAHPDGPLATVTFADLGGRSSTPSSTVCWRRVTPAALRRAT